MKTLFTLFLSCFIAAQADAQLLNFNYNYEFEGAYNSRGYEVEMPGHPFKVFVAVVTTNFFGIVQSSCSYFEYDQMTGELGQPITLRNYMGIKNGWYVYNWYNSFVYIKTDLSRVRIQLGFYNGNYIEYTQE
ncbi:MAG: hypothetical protein IJJ90_07510 [Prevotella sp.]|nr:hypothetical protein [Prevotella sp.]